MFINNIKNLKKNEFMKLLSWNNPWFDDYKFEKDFILINKK